MEVLCPPYLMTQDIAEYLLFKCLNNVFGPMPFTYGSEGEGGSYFTTLIDDKDRWMRDSF